MKTNKSRFNKLWKEAEEKGFIDNKYKTAYVFHCLREKYGLDENQIASVTGYSPVTVSSYLQMIGAKQGESESEIEEFMVENWKKTGLFEFFFPFGAVGGDAVAVRDGELVGIEFETRPGRYLEHGHHLNPMHEKVRFLLCNVSDGTAKESFPQRLTIFTREDLERIIKERGGKEVEINPQAKRLVEEMIAKKLKELYGFKKVTVEC